MEFVVNFVVVHWFLGFGGGLVVGFVFFKNRRWRPFRFGGKNPFSWGEKRRWFAWYSVAVIFEYLTSYLLGHKLYEELAMSVIEAGALTFGLFLADRIKMITEPESWWNGEATPRREDYPLQKPTTESVAPVSSARTETTPTPAQDPSQDKSWAEETIQGLGDATRGAAENAKDAADLAATETGKGLRGFLHGVRQGVNAPLARRKEKADQQRKTREAEREERRKDFQDRIRDY